MRVVPLPPSPPPYQRPNTPPAPVRAHSEPIERLHGQSLAIPALAEHLFAPAALSLNCRMAVSKPVADVPTPDALAYAHPDMPLKTLTAYARAHYLSCVAQLDYADSYLARGEFWKNVNEMKGIIDRLVPPPPYARDPSA